MVGIRVEALFLNKSIHKTDCLHVGTLIFVRKRLIFSAMFFTYEKATHTVNALFLNKKCKLFVEEYPCNNAIVPDYFN